jgi:hypothetical protein
MKSALALIALLTTASAAQFTWDVVPDANVIGYKAYYGLSTNALAAVAVQGRSNNVVSINPMPTGTNYVYVTSVNNAGLESPPSNTITFVNVAPPAPQNLVRQVVITVNIP